MQMKDMNFSQYQLLEILEKHILNVQTTTIKSTITSFVVILALTKRQSLKILQSQIHSVSTVHRLQII